jgi:hypothetical protein
MPRHPHRRLHCETLETRALMAALHNADLPADVTGDGQVTATDPAAVLGALNGEASGDFPDVSGDGILSPLDALLAIQAIDDLLPSASGEGSVAQLVQSPNWNSNIAYPDAPSDPAAIDKLFSNGFPLLPLLTGDGKSPYAQAHRYYVVKQPGQFQVRIFDLGDDNDGYIEQGGNVEFLNLPPGWTAGLENGVVTIHWPQTNPPFAPAQRLTNDLRFRLIDSEGRQSNISVMRLIFLDAAKPEQNPINRFDAANDGKLDYQDAVAIRRELDPPRPIPMRAMGCISKRCGVGNGNYNYGQLLDVNGDNQINQADIDAVVRELERLGVPNLPPQQESEHRQIHVTQTGSEPEPSYVFARDPDGDLYSTTVEILTTDSPITVEPDSVDPDYYRIRAASAEPGTYELRYRVRDDFGAVSPELTLTVIVDPLPKPFHNAARPADANQDGAVTPLDAMQIIMCLNHGPSAGGGTTLYDVNGDRQLTPLDALLVIEALNAAMNH